MLIAIAVLSLSLIKLVAAVRVSEKGVVEVSCELAFEVMI